VIDTNKEAIAVAEANTLRIPVVAILDSNSSPDGIAYPIPGNDDAMRAVHLYSELVASAVLDGLQAELSASGIDIGARAELPAELPDEIEGADEPIADESFADAAATDAADAEAPPAVH
jgi:small subunit ribosomal protein S2